MKEKRLTAKTPREAFGIVRSVNVGPSFFSVRGLTLNGIVILYPQQTRQASVPRDTLNSGGFLFFRRAV